VRKSAWHRRFPHHPRHVWFGVITIGIASCNLNFYSTCGLQYSSGRIKPDLLNFGVVGDLGGGMTVAKSSIDPGQAAMGANPQPEVAFMVSRS
jgi:hypothetical protein